MSVTLYINGNRLSGVDKVQRKQIKGTATNIIHNINHLQLQHNNSTPKLKVPTPKLPESKPGNSSEVKNFSQQQNVVFSSGVQNSKIASTNMNDISSNSTGIDLLLAAADIIANAESTNANQTNDKDSTNSNTKRCLKFNSDPDYKPQQKNLKKPKNSVPTHSPAPIKMHTIGLHGTQIPQKDFDNMKWHSASVATRKLLAIIFSVETLATHSLTGRPSPAFRGRERPLKLRLNPDIIKDIVQVVLENCDRATEKEVRATVTTKCADTTKMIRMTQQSQNNN